VWLGVLIFFGSASRASISRFQIDRVHRLAAQVYMSQDAESVVQLARRSMGAGRSAGYPSPDAWVAFVLFG